MSMHVIVRSLILVAVFLATVARGESSPPPAQTSTAIVAPREYNWTFFYRGTRYGLEQYGPVAIYRRNTLVVLHSRAYRIPVTAPWAIFIAACVLLTVFGFIAFLFNRSQKDVKMVDACPRSRVVKHGGSSCSLLSCLLF